MSKTLVKEEQIQKIQDLIEFYSMIEKSIVEFNQNEISDIVEKYSYLVDTDDVKSDDNLIENLSAAINMFKILSP